MGNVVLNDASVNDRLLWMRAENVGFGDTQEYLCTMGLMILLEIKNHQVMIPILVMVEKLEGVQPSILQRPRIFFLGSGKYEFKLREYDHPFRISPPKDLT